MCLSVPTAGRRFAYCPTRTKSQRPSRAPLQPLPHKRSIVIQQRKHLFNVNRFRRSKPPRSIQISHTLCLIIVRSVTSK